MYVGSSALRSGATGSRDHGHDDEAGDQQPHASSDPERVQRGQEPHQEQGGPPDAWTVARLRASAIRPIRSFAIVSVCGQIAAQPEHPVKPILFS